MMAEGSYMPTNPAEQQYFDSLWRVANPDGGDLGGKAAVPFFQRSGVDVGILKQIWGLSTPLGTMNKAQFYTALRYITLIQNGELPISTDRLISTVSVFFGLPKFSGVPLPPGPGATHAQGTPNTKQDGGNPQANIAAQYAITPTEHVKYHGLFLKYDNDKDGFITREQSFNVFTQSGLDATTVLPAIFAMADSESNDNKLSGKEFSVAFHLIVCLSKKGLPLPPAIPVPLKGFLLNAPAVPPGMETSGTAAPIHPTKAATQAPAAAAANPNSSIGSIVSVPPTTLSAPASTPVPAPKPVGMAAFDELDPPKTVKDIANTPAAAVFTSSSDEMEVSGAVESIKGAAKKALAIHEKTLDHSSTTASALQNIKQRLAMDRVSLEAAVNNANISGQESSNKLDAVVAEINALQAQLLELRDKLEHARQNEVGVQEQLSKANHEKDRLLKQIEEVRFQIAAKNSDALSKAAEVGTLGQNLTDTRNANANLLERKNEHAERAVALGNEIQLLRAILTSLQNDRDKANHQVTTQQARITSMTSQLRQETDLRAARETSTAQSAQQVAALTVEKQELMAQVAATASLNTAPEVSLAMASNGNITNNSKASAFDDAFGRSDGGSWNSIAEPVTPSSTVGDIAPDATKPEHSSAAVSEVECGMNANLEAKLAAKSDPVEDAFTDFGMSSDKEQNDDPFSGFGDSPSPNIDIANSTSEPRTADEFSTTAIANDNNGFSSSFGTEKIATTDTSVVEAQPDLSSTETLCNSSAYEFGGDIPPISPTVPAPASAPTLSPTNSVKVGSGKEISDNDSSSPFAASANRTTPATAPASNGSDAFDAFGAATSTSAPTGGSDGFDAFGAAEPTAPASDGSDAFDAFGAAASTSAPTGGSDGFDAFGTSEHPVQHSAGFDAFGSDNTTSSKGIPSNDDPFNSATASDDPFAGFD